MLLSPAGPASLRNATDQKTGMSTQNKDGGHGDGMQKESLCLLIDLCYAVADSFFLLLRQARAAKLAGSLHQAPQWVILEYPAWLVHPYPRATASRTNAPNAYK